MASDDIYNLLTPLLDECMKHFANDDNPTSKKFAQSLKSIHSNATHIQPIAVDLVAKVAYRYDASPEIKANGYRSLLALLESLLHMIVANLQTICKERKNMFFRSNQYSDKLRCLAQNLHQMRALFCYAQHIIGNSDDGTLFIEESESDDIMHDCEIMAKSCFYSYIQGFQYYEGIQPIIQALSMFTASYNDISENKTVWQTTKSLFNSGKYVVSPSVRGKKIEKIYSEADAKFFKAFFSLPEMGLGVMLPNIVGETVKVNRIFNLPPTTFELDALDGDTVTIKRLSQKEKMGCVKARLISGKLRECQDSPDSPSLPDAGPDKSKVGFKKTRYHAKSRSLIFFCHGGGFISLTSKSYEIVLREWTKELDCPIFSIDYSLAPDSAFPEAFEECFYAYAWALKNPHLLGTTAENIIFAGDSAGGNLILSVAMRAAAYNIQTPNALLAMYPSCVVRYSASPSRLLAVMDPLLSHCMLSACLCAYTGFRTEQVDYNQEEHKILNSDGDEEHSSGQPETPCSSKRSQNDNSIITTFLQDVGEGLSRFASSSTTPPGHGESETWWDNEIFTYENDYKRDPQHTPFTFSGLLKGIGDRFSKLVSHDAEQKNTFWDNEFDPISIEESDEVEGETEESEKGGPNAGVMSSDQNGNKKPKAERATSSDSDQGDEEEAHFKMKLPQGFMPLKSKYFGKRTKVHHTALVKNPYISPALAPDNMLRTLPHVDIVGCELDPLFDDSVTLSRRLHKIGKDHQLHVVRGLPHGFLSLQMCKETKEASKMCLELLREKMANFRETEV